MSLKTIILTDRQPLFHDFALALCMMAFYDPNDLWWENSFCRHHNNFFTFFYYLCEKKETSFSSCKVVLLHRKSDTIIRWWEHSQLIDHSYRILHRCASCQVLRDFPLEFRWQEVNPCRARKAKMMCIMYARVVFFLKKNQAIWRRNTGCSAKNWTLLGGCSSAGDPPTTPVIISSDAEPPRASFEGRRNKVRRLLTALSRFF